MYEFVAIDFETATGHPYSACSVGLVTICDGIIVDEYQALFQPPDNEYWYCNICVHGITPEMTADLPGFYAVYPEIKKRLFRKVVVAHNEMFDRNVLKAVMRMYQLDYDELEIAAKWECTCRIYRSMGYKPASLDACCRRNDISLNHHEALSDARGCGLLYQKYLEKKFPLFGKTDEKIV